MGRAIRDITGQEFGRLTAMHRLNKRGPGWWECLCACGDVVKVRLNALTSGSTQSCGCSRSLKGTDGRDYIAMELGILEMQGGE
jgi:hypothetical protein